MATVITYVCDCCGGESTNLAKFEPQPTVLTLNSWVVRIDSVLLCTLCGTQLVSETLTAIAALENSRAGQQL